MTWTLGMALDAMERLVAEQKAEIERLQADKVILKDALNVRTDLAIQQDAEIERLLTEQLEMYAKHAMPGYPEDVCSRAKAMIERLRAALASYGDHRYECALKNGGYCSCGYEAALKEPTP